MSTATIAALDVYPVKSCRGLALSRARVRTRGLALEAGSEEVGDREWMIVDADGRFVTQRELPRLALIEVDVERDALRLSADGRPPLQVPLGAPAAATRDVVVWSSTVRAHDAGDAAAAWLAAVLGVGVRLVRFDAAQERLCNPDYAGDSGAHTAFADGYPLLVVGAASLADLNARLAAQGEPALPMNRFRPNLVLAGLDAYDEDHLDTIETDGVVLRVVKPCTRCVTTTTDQATAVRGVEPLRTLGAYRRHATLGGVAFGMNAIVVAGAGRELAVGAGARCEFRF
ncbi:MAG TPA: MOSC N-terminal beta barrel domain-containing protein [Casimicrobiaceae bacterium]|nr:MOSC N-terminal beta barrel domain-containing protein [Casimicrobiaceae bacterium]